MELVQCSWLVSRSGNTIGMIHNKYMGLVKSREEKAKSEPPMHDEHSKGMGGMDLADHC